MEESFWKRLWTCRQADSILNNNNYHLIFSYICPLLHVCVQYFLPFWYSVSSYIFPSFSSNFIPIFLLPSPLSPLFSSILLPSFQILFHTSINPFFLLVILSSLPFPLPPSKFYFNFIFSSRKFKYFLCVRFYRKSCISRHKN